jgi:hypothetical protein
VETYILDTFSSPANVSSPPFAFTSNDGYKLTLNGSGTATGATGLSGNITAPINKALTYNSNTGTIDQGESFVNFAAYVNSEIGKLDDVGFVADGSSDAPLNIDYGNDASVLFNIPTGGLTKLLIAEDAGLDPYRLEHCMGINSGCTTLFDGWTTSGSGNVQSILTSHGFGLNDNGTDIDQAFLFVFDAPVTGYFRLSETSNPDSDSSRLELDFIGGVTATPEPGVFGLLGIGMTGLFYVARRRKLAQ